MSVTGNQIYCVKCGQEITESQWAAGSVGAMHWKCYWGFTAPAQPSDFCIHSVLTPGCESCELKRQKWGIAAPAQPVFSSTAPKCNCRIGKSSQGPWFTYDPIKCLIHGHTPELGVATERK